MSIDDLVRGSLTPPTRPSVVEWAESQLYLSDRVSPNQPGPFSTLNTPYMREVLEAFADPRITDITLCWGSQNGKTLTMLIGCLWRALYVPMPTLWVMPTEANARSFSQSRLQPLIDDNPILAALKPDDRDLYKLLEMHLKKCTLALVGSNSPANLASRPIGTLICDEVDKYATATARETSALRLAEQRTKAMPGALRLKTSTPTVPEADIWQEYQRGDQRHYLVPCPECSHVQPLIFPQIKWDPEAKDETGIWIADCVRRTAHYECSACKAQIRDAQKLSMLRRGGWSSQNPPAPTGVRSYHLNSIYSPWVTFGDMATHFLQGQDLFGLQDFTNGYLALPWEEHELNLKDTTVLECALDYPRATCPIDDPVIVTICADVHQVHTNWTVEARADDGTAYVIDWGELLSPEDLLRKIPTLAYPTPSGQTVRPVRGLVDSGYATERVYGVCFASQGVLTPSKGSQATDGRPWGRTRLPNYRGMQLITYLDHAAKSELYDYRIDKKRAPAWHIPSNADRDFLKQHSNQRLIRNHSQRGALRWKSIADDHYGDCSKLHLVLWWALNENLTPPAP